MKSLTISEHIEKIKKLELEKLNLEKERDALRNEKQIIISKEGAIDHKLTVRSSELSELWSLLKETIVKGLEK